MIDRTYSDILLEQALLDRYFSRRRSASTRQIEALQDQIDRSQPGASGSEIDYAPDYLSIASRADLEQALETFAQELNAIRQETAVLETTTRQVFDWAENDLAITQVLASTTALQICALRTAKQYGLSWAYAESLASLTGIDQNRSSTELDAPARAARLRSRPDSTRIPLVHLEDNAFDAFLVGAPTATLEAVRGSRLFHAVDDADSFWMVRAHRNTPAPTTLAFQVQLDTTHAVSRVALTPFGAAGAGLVIRVLGSLDGTTWREFQPKTRTVGERFTVDSLAMEARWIRIEMTRTDPHYVLDGQAVYEFGLNDLHLYEHLYYPESELITEAISFVDPRGSTQTIGRVRLQAYETKPAGTEILYTIRTAPNGPARRIVPGETLTLATLDPIRIDRAGILRRLDEQHVFIDIPIHAAIALETVRFFDNVYQKDLQADGVQTGWSYDRGFYHCIFELETTTDFNFGHEPAYIDGQKVVGITTVEPGIHAFQTHESNWRPAAEERDDPLFPYNHRLLLEGLSGSTTYPGVPFLAARELRMVSARDLRESIDPKDDRFFALASGYPVLKIPTGESTESWRIKRHGIRYQIRDTTADAITAVWLSARLRSNHPRLSPELKGFVLMAGA